MQSTWPRSPSNSAGNLPGSMVTSLSPNLPPSLSNRAVSASDGDGVAPAYESRSFGEVKLQNVDLNLVPAPLCRKFRTATVTPRTSG